jgi:sterol desaturase/sphingolipid hydroxylase (fatty acid hydroxylase superfamily)
MLGALTSYNRCGPSSRGNRSADIAVTIVLLIVHAFLWGATVALLGLLVMVTDSCGYQRCGDPAWIDRAMWLGLGAGAAIFIADLVAAVSRLALHRVAFFVPVIGCAAQLGLAIGAAAMESLAGPVS